MSLSEREKKYVISLIVLILVATSFYFYTIAVEPFIYQQEVYAIEIESLYQEELLQQTKLRQDAPLGQELELKKQEAMALSSPFFPELPQDRIVLLVQELVRESGLSVTQSTYSSPALGGPAEMPPALQELSYDLKTLAYIATGKEAPLAPPADGAVAEPPPAEGAAGIPQVAVSLTFSGTERNVLELIGAVEAENRTITITQLSQTQEPDGTISGTVTLNFYAVEKLMPDPFMDWSEAEAEGRDNLFRDTLPQPAPLVEAITE